jgi:hypothetical protein
MRTSDVAGSLPEAGCRRQDSNLSEPGGRAEVFEGGIAHEDGAISLQLGGVEFVIARRE